MTTAIAPTSLRDTAEQPMMSQGADLAPSVYLKQRTTRRRRILPNIDCIQLDQPTVWDVSMPSEFGSDSDSGAAPVPRQTAPQKPKKKTKKPLKFINKTTNSWVSTNTTTTVVLPGATVQFSGPLGPLRGSLPASSGRGESPYEDVRMGSTPQAYLDYMPPPHGAQQPQQPQQMRVVPRMAPPSSGLAPHTTAAGPRDFTYMEAYGAVLHRPNVIPASAYRSGSSRVEVLEDSVPPQRVPKGMTPDPSEPRRATLPVVAHSADRMGLSAVPSANARAASYDGGVGGGLSQPQRNAAPGDRLLYVASPPNGARLSGSRPIPHQNNYMTSPSDRVVVMSVSQRTPDEASSSALHPNSDSSRNPRPPHAAEPEPVAAGGLTGPRYYAQLDRKNTYAEGTEQDSKGVEDLMFADEL